MCRLSIITPVVWKIRIERLIAHLVNEEFVLYEACSVKYREVDIEKVGCFSRRFVEDIIHELFEIELLVGLRCGCALEMLLMLKNKICLEENNHILHSRLCDVDVNEEILGEIATLPMLVRVKIAEQLIL